MLIRPIDPDVTNQTMFHDMEWYNTPKLPGFSFMIRAKNESKNIENSIRSVLDNMNPNVPFNIVVVDNDSSDDTFQKASDLLDLKRDKIVKYPYRLAKPGLEVAYTPPDSIHSFVYFSQFCMMQCSRQFIFRWDADFEMTPQLGNLLQMLWQDHLVKLEFNCKTFDYFYLPCRDLDGITNSELYVFNVKMDPFWSMLAMWEHIDCLDPTHVYNYDGSKEPDALIIHNSSLKNVKTSYLEEHWWTAKLQNKDYPADYIKILEEIDIKFKEFAATIPEGSNTFSRSMDPKSDYLNHKLPYVWKYSAVYDALKDLRRKEKGLIDYDFVEIGTSDFDTLIQNASSEQVGLSIEPVRAYYDALPAQPFCYRGNFAVSDIDGTIDVYYVPAYKLEKHGLPWGLRGCNSVGDYHPTTKDTLLKAGLDPSQFFTKSTVPVKSFPTIVQEYGIKSIKYLKIDTEGHDAIILESYLRACHENPSLLAEKIFFENNILSSSERIQKAIRRFVLLGYTVQYLSDDVLMTR